MLLLRLEREETRVGQWDLNSKPTIKTSNYSFQIAQYAKNIPHILSIILSATTMRGKALLKKEAANLGVGTIEKKELLVGRESELQS